jgi:uncharacterized damage-inducible protein DinB
LRFTRSVLDRTLYGISEEEGFLRFGRINSIGWIVGHVANHEQRLWLVRLGKPPVIADLHDRVASGRPASTPSLAEMLEARKAIIAASDPYLDSLQEADMEVNDSVTQPPFPEPPGTSLQRLIYHQWFHNGEIQAIRQMLGHTSLPQFVGKIGEQAPYRRD